MLQEVHIKENIKSNKCEIYFLESSHQVQGIAQNL